MKLKQWPSIRDAPLPENYKEALKALSDFERADRSKKFETREDMLAYCRFLATDETFIKLATAIQARAVRECGKLMSEIEWS